MTSVGDSFAWPFQDPGWFGKMIIQGLIGIIPIVGWIAMVGWFLMILDNYRAGRRELPAAGFHLERGVGLFVVFLVYVIVFSLPGLLLTGIGNRSDSAGLADVDENDPKSMARWAKTMGQQMGGDELGEDFDQVVDEMGDAGTDEPDGADDDDL